MNASFFTLPKEKQENLINAAYQVFSKYEYKKAPMSEIAAAGDVSKSLLFYYFKNKKELYFFLWEYAIEKIKEVMLEFKVADTNDFFEMLERSLMAKCSMISAYPYLYVFTLKAYYEAEPEIQECIVEWFTLETRSSKQILLEKVDLSVFREDINLSLMYQEMIWASDGYLRQMIVSGHLDARCMEQEIMELIALWKKVYLK